MSVCNLLTVKSVGSQIVQAPLISLLLLGHRREPIMAEGGVRKTVEPLMAQKPGQRILASAPSPTAKEDEEKIREMIKMRSSSWQSQMAMEKQKKSDDTAVSMDEDAEQKSMWVEMWEDFQEWLKAPGYLIEVGVPVLLLLLIVLLSCYGFVLQYRKSWRQQPFGAHIVGDGIDHHPEHSSEL